MNIVKLIEKTIRTIGGWTKKMQAQNIITKGHRETNFDFINPDDSDDLKKLKAICVGFYNIKLKKLYKSEHNNFDEYLKAERINIPFNIAQGYSEIGEILIERKNQFEPKQIEFKIFDLFIKHVGRRRKI